MKQYAEEFKESVIARMLPPNNANIPELAMETGIPKDTLYSWRIKHRKSKVNRIAGTDQAGNFSSEEIYAIVVETASMNENELSAYCRRKGLYCEQIDVWRKHCQQANAAQNTRADRGLIGKQVQRIKSLELELRRKDKALAETAALLVLKKKVREILAGPEDEW
jgi:transposase-like protein